MGQEERRAAQAQAESGSSPGGTSHLDHDDHNEDDDNDDHDDVHDDDHDDHDDDHHDDKGGFDLMMVIVGLWRAEPGKVKARVVAAEN